MTCCWFTHAIGLISLTTPIPAVLELELSRHADVNVRGLWVSAEHTLIALQLGNTYENHYIHANWKKGRILSKLKDVKVSCIGWNKDTQSESTTG